MKPLAKWSIKNRVTVNLIMIFVIAAGLFTVIKMRREMFPQFALDMINVSVSYPGSSPEEVEEGICIKIEEQIQSIEGIKTLRSTAREGGGDVVAEIETGADVQKILNEIKAKVDRIDTFPEEAEEPVVLEIINQDPTISVALFGEVSEKRMRQIAEKIRDDLLDAKPVAHSGSGGLQDIIASFLKRFRFKPSESITQIDLVGVRDYEIRVDVRQDALLQQGISLPAVADAVRAWMTEVPGGTVKGASGNVKVRTMGVKERAENIRNIIIKSTPDGRTITLGDIARVHEGFVDDLIINRFNSRDVSAGAATSGGCAQR